MQWRPSPSAAADPRLSVKKRGSELINSGRTVTGLQNEDVEERERIKRQCTLQDAGTPSRGSKPSSSLPWSHERQLHPARIRHLDTCLRASEPSFQTPVLSTAQLAASDLQSEGPRHYALL